MDATHAVPTISRARVANLAAAIATLAFVAVLGWLLPQPGYSWTRLVLFALLSLSAVAGATGVVTERFRLTLAGVVGLFLLGFWQAVLSVFVYPLVAVLLVTAVANGSAGTDERSTVAERTNQ